MERLVSIIVLNWNGEQHIHRCLEHVVAQSHARLEVIVVDNGSTDGSLQKIKARYNDFAYIENDCNRGYSIGMNQGIGASHGDFVLPLNQDVCLEPNYVAYCVSRMMSDPTIGAMGGRVFSWIGDQLVNERRRGEGEKTVWRKRFKVDGGIEVENEIWTFCPSGSFPFLRKAMLDDVLNATGCHYDEAFETGWEDADLFFRMHLRGWKCLFAPETFGWHVSSGSVGGNSTFLSKKLNYQTRVLRNRYFTMIKNLPRPMLLRLAPYLVVAEIALVPYFVLRSPKSLLALGSAYWQVLESFPSLLNKRRIVQSNRKVPPMYLQQFFAGF